MSIIFMLFDIFIIKIEFVENLIVVQKLPFSFVIRNLLKII